MNGQQPLHRRLNLETIPEGVNLAERLGTKPPTTRGVILIVIDRGVQLRARVSKRGISSWVATNDAGDEVESILVREVLDGETRCWLYVVNPASDRVIRYQVPCWRYQEPTSNQGQGT